MPRNVNSKEELADGMKLTLQQYEAVSQNSEMPHQARNHLGILGGAKSF